MSQGPAPAHREGSALVPPGRPGGRPRSARADRAIVTATLELIAEDGFEALSVEAVAARAGVGKTTIYRRFTCRDDLVAEALATLNDDLPPVPDGVPARQALVQMLDGMRARADSTVAGRIMARVVGQAATNPDLVRVFHDRVVAPRRVRLLGVLRAAVVAGQVRGDVDLELAATLLVGPVLYQAWWGCAVPSPASSADIVDAVLGGIGDHPRGAGCPA